ncbi:MAG: pyridoxal-phosphate dependent enzyme [Candidatus Thermoplasmatota archaeon]
MTYGIGETSLVRAKNLEEYLEVEHLFLKLEGENPTGTHKDRLAIQHVDDAIIRGHETITVGSCGNYGVAMSFVANKSKLDCKVFVPEKYTGEKIDTIKSHSSEVFRVEGGYEEAVQASREKAKKNGWYDANPGGKNTPISLVAYVDVAEEIQEELGRPPDSVSVSVGNGTTLAGLHLGFRLLWRKDRAGHIPHMLGASSSGNNAVIETVRQGKREMIELSPEDIRESEVNEPLLNWRSLDGQEAINAIYDTKGIAVGLDDDELVHYKDLILENENIDCLPASASALGALKRYLEDEEDRSGTHVIVLTSGEKHVRD